MSPCSFLPNVIMFRCGTRIASVTIHQLLGRLCCLWAVGHQTTWRTCIGAEERCFQRGHKDPASIVVLIGDLVCRSMFVGCAFDCWKRTMTIVGIVFSLRGCHSPQADPLPESRGTQMFAAWTGRQDCLDVPWVRCTNAWCRCIRHHFEVFERFGSDAFEEDHPLVGRVFDLESTVMRHKGFVPVFEVLYLLIASCDDNTDWKEFDCSHNLQRMVGSLWHVAASRWHNVLLSTALCAVSDPAAGSECYPAWTFIAGATWHIASVTKYKVCDCLESLFDLSLRWHWHGCGFWSAGLAARPLGCRKYRGAGNFGGSWWGGAGARAVAEAGRWKDFGAFGRT